MRFRNVFPRKADVSDLAEIDSIFDYFREHADQYNEMVDMGEKPPLSWEDITQEDLEES